jgi:ATP-dependent exoDNAse (exonuclease V) beta subunit
MRLYKDNSSNKYHFSTNTILDILKHGKFTSDPIPAKNQDAMKRGSFFHSLIENYFEDEKRHEHLLSQCDELQRNQFNKLETSILSPLKEKNRIYATELGLVCPTAPFGGRLDAVMKYCGMLTICDWKTTGSLFVLKRYLERYYVQLASYKHLIESNYNINIDCIAVIAIDGKQDIGQYLIYDADLQEWSDRWSEQLEIFKSKYYDDAINFCQENKMVVDYQYVSKPDIAF